MYIKSFVIEMIIYCWYFLHHDLSSHLILRNLLFLIILLTTDCDFRYPLTILFILSTLFVPSWCVHPKFIWTCRTYLRVCDHMFAKLIFLKTEIWWKPLLHCVKWLHQTDRQIISNCFLQSYYNSEKPQKVKLSWFEFFSTFHLFCCWMSFFIGILCCIITTVVILC